MDKMSGKNSRLDYIDVCKSVGITIVIIGHWYRVPWTLYISFISFSMPLFFVLSGFVYNREKNNKMGFSKFLKRKFTQIMVPYWIFGLANLVIESLTNIFWYRTGITTEYIISNLKGILLCSGLYPMPNCIPIWFLMCLFFASLVFWFVMKLDFKYSPFVVVGIVVLYCCYIRFFNGLLPDAFKFPTFLLAVLYLYIGYCLRLFINKYGEKIKRIPVVIVSVSVISACIALVVITDNAVNMGGNKLGNYFVFFTASILIPVFMIIFFSKVRILENRFFLWLGKNTLYVIGFNYQCIFLWNEIHYLIPGLRDTEVHWTLEVVIIYLFCMLSIVICISFRNLYNRIVHLKQKEG